MDERYMRRRKLRKFQIFLATFIFLITIVYCWNVTDYDITEIQLSKFGIHENSKHWWNISMVLISHFILRNICSFLDENQRIKRNRVWKQLFGLSCLGLAIVGIVPMEAGIFDLHDVAAWGYFFMFPMAILFMAFFERKNIQHSEFLHHTWTAAAMSFLPIIAFEFFHGFAIPEMIHSLIVLYWNLYIFFKYK